MAKKNAPMQSQPQILDIVGNFGNVNCGDKTARIGFSVSRSDLKLGKAEQTFCERRLRAVLVIRPNGNHPSQGDLPGMEEKDTELESIFDVKSIRFTADEIAFGLTAALGSIDVGKLAKFAKRTGRLIVNDAREIPEPEKSRKEDDDEEA